MQNIYDIWTEAMGFDMMKTSDTEGENQHWDFYTPDFHEGWSIEDHNQHFSEMFDGADPEWTAPLGFWLCARVVVDGTSTFTQEIFTDGEGNFFDSESGKDLIWQRTTTETE